MFVVVVVVVVVVGNCHLFWHCGRSFFGSIAGAQINGNFEATETEQLVL